MKSRLKAAIACTVIAVIFTAFTLDSLATLPQLLPAEPWQSVSKNLTDQNPFNLQLVNVLGPYYYPGSNVTLSENHTLNAT